MSAPKGKLIGDLEALVKHVLTKAEARAEALLGEARAQAKRELREAANRARRREEELVEAGLKEIELEKRRLLARAELEARGRRLEAEHAILEELEGEIERWFLGIREKDPSLYGRVLAALLKGALAGEEGLGEVIIRLAPVDLEAFGEELGRLARKLGAARARLEPGDLRGGVIVELPDRNLMLDQSLSEIMREFRPRLEKLLRDEVFSRHADTGR